jgi:hypothetical protein
VTYRFNIHLENLENLKNDRKVLKELKKELEIANLNENK